MAKDTSITKNLAAATGGAWIGELVTIPFDSLKVLSQINTSSGQRPSTMALARGTIAEHGVLSLWSGLQAGMLRHLLFASLRIGLYEPIRNVVAKDPHAPTLPERIASAMTSGALAMCVGSPADLMKVQSQSARVRALEAGLPPRVPPLRELASTIWASRGLAGFYRGLGPNVVRNSLVNASEIAAYDTFKTFFIKNLGWDDDNFGTFLASASLTGLTATVVSSPIDVIKTRVMSMQVASAKGQAAPSSGALAVKVTRDLIATEGPQAFFRGFVPNFLRMGAFNVIMFMSFEYFKKQLGA